MESLINYSIQINLYLILLLACYHWGIRQTTNFQLSRLFLLVGIATSLLLPFIRFNVSSETLAQMPTIQLQESFIQPTTESTTSGTSIALWFLTLYLIGVFIAASRMLYGMHQVYKLKRSCRKVDEYYEIPNSNAAFSFMHSIFIGENLSEDQQEVVLKHEKIHLSKFHYIDLLVVQLLEIFLFYNPFIYRFNSLFKEVHEYEADHYSAEKKDSYIAHLLSKHFDINEFSVVHQFNSNHIKSRIMRIKNTKKQPIKPTAIIMSILLFGAIFMLNQNSQAQGENKQETKKTEQKVDQYAEYPGGNQALMNYIQQNTKYPKSAKENKISGTVYIELTISAEGNIQTVKMLKGIKNGEDINEEAIRVVKSISKKWKPAVKDGKAVASNVQIPIRFNLSEEDKKDN